MALALRLFLLLLLAVALPARAAQAAPLQVWGADWDNDMDYLDALLDDGLKPLENAGGTPSGKNQDRGDKKSLEAAKLLDKMLSDLERHREMDRKAVLKAALPRGSRGSLAASAAGRKVMPGTVPGGNCCASGPEPCSGLRHHLGCVAVPVLQGCVTGPAKRVESEQEPAQSFPRPLCSFGLVHSHLAPTALSDPLAVPHSLRQRGIPAHHGNGSGLFSPLDESAGMALPAAGMEDGLETLGASAGMSAGRTFPGPLVDVAHKPSSHGRGPLRGRKKPTKQNISLEESKKLEQILSDLERRREMEQKALLKAALPGGSNHPMPDTISGIEEMRDSAIEDVVTEVGIYAPDPVFLPRIVCPQDVRRSCMIGTVVTVITVPLLLICCYFGIRKLYEMRRLLKLMML